MYRHRYQQGNFFPALVLCTDGTQLPVLPTEAPTADFWSGGTRIKTVQLPAFDAGAVSGLFGTQVFIGAEFAPGLYQVAYRWRTGSYNGQALDLFEVSPGGNADGTVVSMFELNRPQAKYIVQQTDAGKLKRGRNPRM